MTAEESGTTTAAAMDVDEVDHNFVIKLFKLRSQVVEEAEEQFVVFCVRIHLREGHGLAVRDASGQLAKGIPSFDGWQLDFRFVQAAVIPT
jgi:hypothetical protein